METKNKLVLLSIAAVLMVSFMGVAYADLAVPIGVPISTTTITRINSTSHTITVFGNGVSSVSPNEAEVSVGVTVQAPTAQAAANKSAQIVNQIINQLQSIGISRSNISTTYYSVYPTYNYEASQEAITGYTANYELKITILNSDLALLASKSAQAIDTSVGAGANEVSGVEFTATDQALQQAKNQALQLAIQDAASRANVAASSLGVQLGGVQSMTEEQVSTYPMPYYGVAMPLTSSVSASTQIAPQNFTMSDSVEVTYIVQ